VIFTNTLQFNLLGEFQPKICFNLGRSDGESVLKLIQQLKPRRVIVVRGNADKIQTLVDISRQVMAKNTTTSDGVTCLIKIILNLRIQS
jgi:hypothetical protein